MRLRRRLFDATVVALAVAAVVEAWIAPPSESRSVFVVASLLWTLPLLLRHRFPFAAPVFAFCVQAGSAFAKPTIGTQPKATIALLLAFWAVGAGRAGRRRRGARGGRLGLPDGRRDLPDRVRAPAARQTGA